jgi:hypothetical protein
MTYKTNELKEESFDCLSIINIVIANNPMKYTMLDNETKVCFAEEMEMLPEHYTIENLEEYVFENLPTDTQINASLYGIGELEQEVLESACNKYGFDFEDALKSGF